MSPSERYGRLIIVVAVLGGVAALISAAFVWLSEPPVRFALIEEGALGWYEIKNGSIVLAGGPVGFDDVEVTVLAATPTLRSGDRYVLFASPEQESGVALGRVYRDGTYVPLVDDGTQKLRIAADDRGLVAYIAYAGTPEDEIGDEGWTVYALDAARSGTPSPDERGEGFMVSFAEDGALLALAPEGLVRLDEAGGRFTVLEAGEASIFSGALSPDGSLVAIPNATTNALDVFSVDKKDSRALSYIGSASVSASASAFISPTLLIARDEQGTFHSFDVSQNGVVRARTYSLSSP